MTSLAANSHNSQPKFVLKHIARVKATPPTRSIIQLCKQGRISLIKFVTDTITYVLSTIGCCLPLKDVHPKFVGALVWLWNASCSFTFIEPRRCTM